jgi:cytochrome c556
MHAFKRAAAVLLLSLLSSAAQQSARAQDSDPQDVITYRELIMKELEAEAAALGLMVAGQIPPDNLTLQAKAAAASARSALKAFEPKVPGGEAKPEVWANWADFAKRMQSLAQGAEEMAKASEGNNLQAVSGLIVTALPCKECHDTYRNKKK